MRITQIADVELYENDMFHDLASYNEINYHLFQLYIQYGVDNTTIFEQLSRNAFLSLQSETYIEPPLLTPEEKRRKIASSPKDALKKSQLAVKIGDAETVRRHPECEGQLFKQRIRMEGCSSKVVINRYCHGTCSSYYIPRLRPRKLKLKAMFQSCSACRPSEYDTIEVKLDCPKKNPAHLIRRVVKVKKCSCMALNVDQPDENDELLGDRSGSLV
ncbi:unnamed protein product [Anisakis simplex]|uniref:Bursicon n=1 Tax=Anisakis simplex TaxID=6269 RepID=A0A0M3K7B7_ANISI|nr:unnamed protein product [Anisakis simplex]